MLLPLRRLCPSCGRNEQNKHGLCTECCQIKRRVEKWRKGK